MWQRLVTAWRSIWHRERMERELSEELQDHLERETAALRARGLSDVEARRTALRAFGSVDRVRDEVRDARGVAAVDAAWRDTWLAFRRLRRSGAYAGLVVVTLALGLGATAVIVSAVDGVLLKPLPYRDADGLVTLRQTRPALAVTDDDTSVGTFLDWQAQTSTMSRLEAANPWGVNYRVDGVTTVLEAWTVTEGFFELFATPPLIGRTFREEDFAVAGRATLDDTAAPGPRPASAVVLSYDFWQRMFGGDPSVVGRSIELDRTLHTIVGVMPRGFDMPGPTDAWLTSVWSEDQRLDRFGTYIKVFGRLTPGVSLPAARADMDAVARRLEQAWPRSNVGVGVRVVRLDEYVIGTHRRVMLLLLGAVGLLLLVTLISVGALQTLRLARQRRDVTVQAALGARPLDVLRPAVLESLFLASAGATLGLVLAVWGTRLLRSLAPPNLPRADGIVVDMRTVGVVAALAVGASLVTTLVALRRGLAAVDVGGRTITAGRSVLSMRRAAVSLQLALGFVLLAGTSLLVHSFLDVLSVDRGYQTENRLSFTVWVSNEYPNRQALTAFVTQVMDRMAALPGVRSVAHASALPLTEGITGEMADIVIPGQPAPEGEEPQARATVVSPSFFRTLGIRLVRGRLFDESDTASGRPTVLVNESFARRFFEGRDPIGQDVAVGLMGRATPRTIVGVVADTRHTGLDQSPDPGVFLVFAQRPLAALTFVLATSLPSDQIARAVGRVMGELDPRVGVARFATMDALVDRTLKPRRFLLTLVAAFAIVSVLVAVVGVYGAMSQAVAEREREIAVRMALGASFRDVGGQFAREAARITTAGLTVGLLTSTMAMRVLEGFLYGVTPLDPSSLSQAVALVALLAVVAALVPTWRATRVDPTVALHEQ